MSHGILRMSDKERFRLRILDQVQLGRLTVVEASSRMGVSYRQGRRLRKEYAAHGAAGLVHGLRGRPSNRRTAPWFRAEVLAHYRRSYGDFGPRLASEKLAEREGLKVHEETLRRWLHEAHLWVSSRPARVHRRRRARRAQFGALVQLDGSTHAWLEERGPSCCLMVLVDDATGRCHGWLAEAETTGAALVALRGWIERYGVPAALYTDRHSIYAPARAPTAAERAQGSGPLSDFGRACWRLGIERIAAHSPQAKGRVERKNGLLQDRLVKELRLRGISSIAEANAMLPAFLDTLNARFAVAAGSPLNSHRQAPEAAALDAILCWECPRKVGRDWTVQYEGRVFQLLNQNPLPAPRTEVTVRRHLDESIAIVYQDRVLASAECPPAHTVPFPPPPRGGGGKASPPGRTRPAPGGHF